MYYLVYLEELEEVCEGVDDHAAQLYGHESCN